jgi:MATE family multidrug resistance protein
MSEAAKIENASAPALLPWRQHLRETLTLGLPLVATQLAQIATGVTDTVMVGWLGAAELAAVVLGSQTFFIVLIFGGGIAQAIVPLVAAARGAGDERGVRRNVRMGLWVVFAYSFIALIILSQTEPMLLALGQDARTSAWAADYMTIVMWAIFPALTVFALRAFLMSLEKGAVVLVATIAAAMANGLLNYALIFGNFGSPPLGIRGAAIATLVSTCAGATFLIAYCIWHPAARHYEIFVRFWRPDWPAFRDVLRLGLPISGTIIAEVSLFFVASIMMGWLGVIPLAAHGIALQIASITFMIPLGMSMAATVRIGLAYGRGDMANLGRAAATVQWLSAAIAFMAAISFWLFPELLIRLFLDDTDADAPAVLAAAIPLLLGAAAFQVVDAMQAIGTGLLRGLKDSRVPMMMAIFSYWGIGFPAAYLVGFPLGLGGLGVWIGLASGLAVAALLMNWRFAQRERLGLLPRAI